MLHVAVVALFGGAASAAAFGELLEAAYARSRLKSSKSGWRIMSVLSQVRAPNELHSILGLEFADLGSELETHYAEYFSNRAALLKLHAQYNQKFTSAEAEADAGKQSR